MNHQIERRRFPRINVDLYCRPASVFEYQHEMHNVSFGGIRIYSDQPHRVGEHLDLELFLPDNSEVHCKVEVVWVSEAPEAKQAKYDVGLRFMKIREDHLDILKQHINKENLSMKATDYSQIAENYDKNPDRGRFPEERLIRKMVGSAEELPIQVADIGCGTGNYESAQNQYFSRSKIQWHCVEPNQDMIKIAQSKLPDLDIQKGTAESLPLQDESMDLWVSNFSYHHFEDKSTAFNEAARVLKPGRFLKIYNIAPFDMPDWWVFVYFPEAMGYDRERFLSVHTLYRMLESKGFAIQNLTIQKTLKRKPLEEIIYTAKNRDISELALLTDKEYKNGMARLEAAAEIADHHTQMFAQLSVEAQKK
ncbi:MAG: methyltransferase domain-containing protein [Spirochaetia bacterium]